MCYTGDCVYENLEGDCEIPLYKKGKNGSCYPSDALCVMQDKEIEEQQRKRKSKQKEVQ